MAGDHEYVEEYGHDVVSLYNTCVYEAIILGVDTDSDTADIEVTTAGIGRVNGVPIFYHCPGSDTVEGGSVAFVEDDVVLVLGKGCKDSINPGLSMKIIGFADGLRGCCLAIEKFTTGEITYMWESYITPPQTWGWVVDNTTFSGDQMSFNTTFKFNYVGTVTLTAERFVKGFDSEITYDPYLIINNLPGWSWSGGTPTVITQSVAFFAVFQYDDTWFEYFSRIYRHTLPFGLDGGIYYVDIFGFLRDQGTFPIEGLILRAYGIRAVATDRFVTTVNSNINIDQYDICGSYQDEATKLELSEYAGIIFDPSRYQ